jgi:ApbE superfamily uncharacterized protein (UPF0280 family)
LDPNLTLSEVRVLYEERFYREEIYAKGLVSFQVKLKETDLHISADKDLSAQAFEAVETHRKELEEFIEKHPVFRETFKPYEVPGDAPQIVKDMAEAASPANVGPMAAVAGAIAETVARHLLKFSTQVIVENGGDIFIKTSVPRSIGVFAGTSPLSNKVSLLIRPEQTPLGVCTSAGTVGPSVSLGAADAVVVLSKSCALADAAATAIGNRVHKAEDIDKALKYAQGIEGVSGVVIIKDDQMGVWGEVEIEPL